MVKIGINGFGRIGRLILRTCVLKSLNVVAINDAFLTIDYMEYLFKFDSTHGPFKGTTKISDCKKLIINGTEIAVSREKDPSKIPWKQLDVDFVVECTGIYTTADKARLHLSGGAKFVIITAPSPDVPMVVMGVNEKCLDATMRVVSMACSTTHCLALLAQILHKNFKISEGLMMAVHAMTPTQKVVDSPGCGAKREARGAIQNIIPSCSGAAVAIGHIIPELEGKVTGMSMKVPVADVSVIDFTVRLQEGTTYEEITKKIQSASENELKGLVSWTEDDVVSSDFIGNSASCVFDVKSGIPLNKNFFKLIAWFDNEIAYAYRVIDFINYVTTAALAEPKH